MTGKIKCVIINSHADPFELENMVDVVNISQLKRKNVKRLILLGCNAGHLDHAYTNIAFSFLRRIKGPVIASDGTVWSSGNLANKKSTFDSEADETWQEWRDNKRGYGLRENNLGWIKYISSYKIISNSTYSATINNLCSI